MAYTDVLWHVRAEDAEGFQPPGWLGFEFGRSRWRPWFFRSVVKGEELASEVLSAKSDADGKHGVEITVFDVPADASVSVTAQALVHDVQRQAFAGTSTVWVHPSNVFVACVSKRLRRKIRTV
ncbi:MAG: hypothetical protein R3E66_14630 [bacterium]